MIITTWISLLLFPFYGFSQTFEQIGPFGTNANKIKDPNRWVAVVGDSLVTAAASDDGVSATIPGLRTLFADFFSSHRFTAARIVKEAPTRVFYSAPEFQRASWYKKLLTNFGAKAALRLDSPENSFAYKVARSWGVHASDIVVVGQDGARIGDIPWQLSRIYEMKPGTLPPVVLLSFTANDLCDVRIFEKSLAEIETLYAAELSRAWHSSIHVLRPAQNGTDFIVVAPLNVTGLITNPEIQNKSIVFEGKGTVSCGEVHSGKLEGGTMGARIMARTLGLMCPSVTRTAHGDAEKIQRLRDVQTAMVEAWKKQINLLNAQYNAKKMNWLFVEDVRDLEFVGDDIAGDCFHPSPKGHDKISERVLKAYPEL